MATKKRSEPAPLTPEALHFARVAEEFARGEASEQNGIGTLAEKRLHAVIKRYLSEDESTHERPVADLLADADTPAKKKPMVADILVDGHIFEVQTGSCYPLRKKLEWYMTHTAYNVTVVCPVAAVKYLSWIDPESGQIVSRTRCRRRGQVKDVSRELYWLSQFIGNPRFSIRVLLLELEEYRMKDGWSRDGKRGSNRYDRFPTALLGEVELTSKEDYDLYFLPDTLSHESFTAADYAREAGIRGKATYGLLQLLVELGLLCKSERIGRAQGYRRV
jgi:hypothetical protein